jgi:hypothetical protein
MGRPGYAFARLHPKFENQSDCRASLKAPTSKLGSWAKTFLNKLCVLVVSAPKQPAISSCASLPRGGKHTLSLHDPPQTLLELSPGTTYRRRPGYSQPLANIRHPRCSRAVRTIHSRRPPQRITAHHSAPRHTSEPQQWLTMMGGSAHQLMARARRSIHRGEHGVFQGK